MRCVVLGVLGLLLTTAAGADEGQEKPILALDTGGHTARVNKVLFTPDGRELISVSDDKTIRYWDVASGEPLRVPRPPIGTGYEGMLYAAALSPDGRTLAVGGYGGAGDDIPIYLLSKATGRFERVLKGHTNVILALAFAPDGKHLASGSMDRTARIWEVGSGHCDRVLQGHEKEVHDVTFSPDGTRLATASYDTTGRIWSVADGRTVAVLRGHTKEVICVAWRPDGKVVATGGKDQSIRLWSPDGKSFQGFDGLKNGVPSLSFTANSRRLLFTLGGPGSLLDVGLFDLDAPMEGVRFTRHTNIVLSGALSPDGALAATAGGNDEEIYVWKTADATPVHRLAGKGRAAWSAAWSPDGTSIAWGNTSKYTSPNDLGPLEHAFRLADLEFAGAPDATFRRARPNLGSVSLERSGKTTVAVKRGGEAIATLEIADSYDTVRCFTLLPGDRAAVGSHIGLYLFDTRTGKQTRSLLGHTGEVLAVAPSPDGRYLLSASDDQTMRVWDPDRDEPLLSLFFAGDDWVAWTPEGYYAASPGGESLMGWHVGHGRENMAEFVPAAQFRKTLYRPDVIKLLLSAGSTERALELADRAKGKATVKTKAAAILPPTAEIVEPRRSGKTVDAPALEVKAVARSRGGHPVTALRLLLDGRPYQGQAGVKTFDPPRTGEVAASWAVVLEPGPHKLAVQADSAVSQGLSAEVEVTYAAEEAVVLPTLYVLAVGVAEYPGDLRLNDSAKDAEAIEQTFRGKSKALYKAVEVRTLTDAKATCKAFLGGLTWLRKQMTQKDVGVVFFSGHGMRDGEGNLYLLPVDADPDDLQTTAVGDAQFKTALAGMPGRVIALLDACHAGASGGDRRKGAGSLTDDLVRDLVTDDYGVIVMASSTGREFSLENNVKRQSNFTLAIVEGLSGETDLNKDGSVYLNELDAYVTDRVKVLSKGQQHPVTAKPTSIRSFPLARP